MDDAIESTRYYKQKYIITFYKETEDGDEEFVASFDNIMQLCKYKKLPINDKNLFLIKQELYRAFKKFPAYSRMIDGTPMRVYLIDMFKDDELEEKLEKERRDKCMALKKYVQITSTMNIEVYASIEAIPVITSANASGDRMNAKSGWAKIRVLLTAGTSWYPSEILNWPAVKALAGKEILTIGIQADTITNPDTLKKAEAQAAAIAKGKKAVDLEKEKVKANKAREKEAQQSLELE